MKSLRIEEEPELEPDREEENNKTGKGFLILYRILVAVILLMILVIITGSVYYAVTSGFGTKNKSSQQINSVFNQTEPPRNIFNNIGQLRMTTEDSITVILNVSFPYPPEDRAFLEELNLRTGDFRSATINYLSALKARKLMDMDENEIKNSLLKLFNSFLRLGRIETLHFNEFFIFPGEFTD